MQIAMKVLIALLLVAAGSRLEIGLQQSDVTPRICVAEASYFVDSQAASAEQFNVASKRK